MSLSDEWRLRMNTMQRLILGSFSCIITEREHVQRLQRCPLYPHTRNPGAPTIRREESKISGEKMGRFLVWLNIFIKFASAIFIDT